MAAICIDCGVRLGFFESLVSARCKNCSKIAEEKIRGLKNLIAEASKDYYLTKQEADKIFEYMENSNLTESDTKKCEKLLFKLIRITKFKDREKYRELLNEYGADDYLSEFERRKLEEFRNNFGLSDEDIEDTARYYEHLELLSDIQDGIMPEYDGEDILLSRKEKCYYRTWVRLMEEKTRTRYVGSSDGVSIRVAKGVYYKYGKTRGRKVVDTYETVTDSGYLYITNKKVTFVGSKKNVTYPINKLVDFTKYADAVKFQKENEKKPRTFLVDDDYAIDEIGAIIFAITNQEE